MTVAAGIRPVEVMNHIVFRLPREFSPGNSVTINGVTKEWSTDLQTAEMVFPEDPPPDYKIGNLPAVTIAPDGAEWSNQSQCYYRNMLFEVTGYVSGISTVDAMTKGYALIDDLKAWFAANQRMVLDGETEPRVSRVLIRAERPPMRKSDGQKKLCRMSLQVEIQWHESRYKDADTTVT